MILPRPLVLDSHSLALAEKHLLAADPLLGEVIKKHGPCTLCESAGEPFARLCLSIIGQQLSARAARAIRARALRRLAVFTPESVLRADEEALRADGLSRAKIKYIKALSAMTLREEISFCGLAAMPAEQVIASLVKVPGVGQWTAEMFLIFQLRHADILSVGDAGLQRAVKKLYGEKYDLGKVGKKWRPYASVASWYLWRYLDADI
ncbi:DNA-3-methyladenine glycosylase II [Deltaproteobacteria bacterium]|nr:DNA-3-methyladenine glycosylase II [Deltaproteobacteria bacterium]